MKYMIEYQIRNAGLSHDQNLTNQEALINAFGKWKPEEGLTVHAFVANLANGGCSVPGRGSRAWRRPVVRLEVHLLERCRGRSRGGRRGGGHDRLRVTCVGPCRVERLRHSLPAASRTTRMSCRASGVPLRRCVSCRPALRLRIRAPSSMPRSPGTQASMIHRYVIWRNNHVGDERLRRITNRANVA